MNAIEGQIAIDIYPQRKKKTRVEISSSRPLQVTKTLLGKTPEQALEIIPLIFNLCAVAQSRAALSSIQQDMKLDIDPKMELARDMLLLVEIGKEHLLRIVLDWPKLFNRAAGNQKLAFLNRLTTDFKSALFSQARAFSLDSKLAIDQNKIAVLIEDLEQFLTDNIFATSTGHWLSNDDLHSVGKWFEETDSIAAQAIRTIHQKHWIAQGKTSGKHLPELDSGQLLACFDAPDANHFIAQPTWQGDCCESTCLTRQLQQPLIQSLYEQYQDALITRWLARLVDLARIPQQLAMMLQKIKENNFTHDTVKQPTTGLSQIESARGRLIHRVKIKQGLISDYQILAPTEWNFHPQGIVSQSLMNLKTENKAELCQLAHLIVNVIDPCVGYELRIH